MSMYRKKPVVIEAMQLPFDTRPGDPSTGGYHVAGSEMARHVRGIAVWMVENGYDGNPDGEDVEEWQDSDTHVIDGERVGLPEFGINFLDINTLEGEMHASPGDFIIKGVQGEFYPCKPDIFEQTYEPVDALKGGDDHE